MMVMVDCLGPVLMMASRPDGKSCLDSWLSLEGQLLALQTPITPSFPLSRHSLSRLSRLSLCALGGAPVGGRPPSSVDFSLCGPYPFPSQTFGGQGRKCVQ